MEQLWPEMQSRLHKDVPGTEPVCQIRNNTITDIILRSQGTQTVHTISITVYEETNTTRCTRTSSARSVVNKFLKFDIFALLDLFE